MATADLPRRPAPTPRPALSGGRVPRLWTADEFRPMKEWRLFGDRDLYLDAGTVMERHPEGPRPVLFTQTEYYALGNANYFRNQRVQLIRGVVVQEPPVNPPHAVALYKVMMVAIRTFPTGYMVRVQQPLELGPAGRPEPDVAVAAGSADDYLAGHPTGAALVIEIGDSTLFDDLTVQAELYAEAGIADYWVVDIPNRKLHVLRDPAPVASNGHSYRSQAELAGGEFVSPLAAPAAVIPVAELLP